MAGAEGGSGPIGKMMEGKMIRAISLAAPVCSIGLLLVGCGFTKLPSNAAKSGQPTVPLIGEPCLVRVHEGKVPMAQGAANPFSPPEQATPGEGFRFIAVGFLIGSKQTLAIEDYEVLDRKDDSQIPFAAGGERPGAPQLFYDTETFGEKVALTRGTEESIGMEGQGPDADALLVSWETAAPVLLLIYEVPADLKTITLRHGSRRFQLQPDSGLIDGKKPAVK